MNPMRMLKMFSGAINPQEIAMQMLQNNNNPIMQNLVKMAQEGNYQEVEKVARNIFKEQGRDFDAEAKELQAFMNNLKK